MTVRTREDIRQARYEAGHPSVYTAFPPDTIDDPELREAWATAATCYTTLTPSLERLRIALRRPDWPGSEGTLESNAGLRGALASADDDLLYLVTRGPADYEIPDPVVAEAWAEAASLAILFEEADGAVQHLLGGAA